MKNTTNRYRIIALVIFLIVTIGLTVLFVPIVGGLRTDEGRAAIIDKVDSFGAFGWLYFLIIQALQIVVALIPGEPVEILAGILFGAFGGLILCLIGVLIGSLLVFKLARSIGKPLIDAVVSPEKLAKYAFLKDEKKLELIVFLLFLIPGTPKDLITYFVPLTDIKPLKFYIYSTLARIPSIITSVLIGASLGKGKLILSVIIFGLTAAIGLVGILFNDKITRKRK